VDPALVTETGDMDS